ncbi:MAG: hypothetical protein OK457_09170 [Thaumarchaeota archaeon]|nr:hypothetical protein [Nitrososphaerota archaeon]
MHAGLIDAELIMQVDCELVILLLVEEEDVWGGGRKAMSAEVNSPALEANGTTGTIATALSSNFLVVFS